MFNMIHGKSPEFQLKFTVYDYIKQFFPVLLKKPSSEKVKKRSGMLPYIAFQFSNPTEILLTFFHFKNSQTPEYLFSWSHVPAFYYYYYFPYPFIVHFPHIMVLFDSKQKEPQYHLKVCHKILATQIMTDRRESTTVVRKAYPPTPNGAL